MFGFHWPELMIIVAVALLIFGPKRLPEMGASIGKSIKEFRKGMTELTAPKDEKEEFKPVDPTTLDNLKKASVEPQKLASVEASSPEVPVE